MQKPSAALLAWMPLVMAACAASPPRADLAAEEQAIRAISMRWLELEQADDAAGIAALFASDGTLYRLADEPIVGNAAIEAYLRDDFAKNSGQVVDWQTDRVEIAPGGDFAVEYGSWTETSTDSGGSTEDHGRYMTAFRKVDGAWKIVADMSMSTKAQTPANPGGD